MLDVHKLTLLREVATHGGVTTAATALRMSPSNVSQQLRRLERDAGVALLETHGRGIRLTRAAERLVTHTEKILAILEAAETELHAARGTSSGVLRLTGFHTFAVGLLSAVITELDQRIHGLDLDFTQNDPEAAIGEVVSRRADVAVVDEYRGFPLPATPGLLRIPLGDEPIRAYLPAGATGPADTPWAMEPAGSDAFRWAQSECRAVGFEPLVRYVSPDPYAHRRLLEQGIAAAFLPETVAADLPTSVRQAPGFPPEMRRRYTLILRRGTERSAALIACGEAITAALTDAVHPSHETVYPPSAGNTAPVM